MKKYIVKLSEEEREELQELIAKGQASARKLAHARILRHQRIAVRVGQDGPINALPRRWK